MALTIDRTNETTVELEGRDNTSAGRNMTLDHRPAGPGPLGTARGTLRHAYRHARAS